MSTTRTTTSTPISPSTYTNSENYHDWQDNDLGEEMDEGTLLSMSADQGLDLNDEEAMEYSADVIQAEQEAYFARERAKEKGIKGFQNKGKGKSSGSSGRAFDVSGQLTLQERQQKIQNLKSRTTCRRCGQVKLAIGVEMPAVRRAKEKANRQKVLEKEKDLEMQSPALCTLPFGRMRPPMSRPPSWPTVDPSTSLERYRLPHSCSRARL